MGHNEIEAVEGINSRLRKSFEKYEREATNLLANPNASIEEIMANLTSSERLNSHEHNKIIRIQKIDNDKYKVTANNEIVGMMNGRTFKLLAGMGIISGASAMLAGAATLNPEGVFGTLNSIGNTLGAGDVVTIQNPVDIRLLQDKARGIEGFEKIFSQVKGIGDTVFQSNKQQKEQDVSTAASRSMAARQETESQNQLIQQIAQLAQQRIQAEHDAKNGAATAIGGR